MIYIYIYICIDRKRLKSTFKQPIPTVALQSNVHRPFLGRRLGWSGKTAQCTRKSSEGDFTTLTQTTRIGEPESQKSIHSKGPFCFLHLQVVVRGRVV